MLLRTVLGAVIPSCRKAFFARPIQNQIKIRLGLVPNPRTFTTLTKSPPQELSLLRHPEIQRISETVPNRTLTKYSLRKGKRKSVKAVLKRFYRLDWGIWIRTKAGRRKKLWKKSAQRRRRLRQHVFCNARQSTLLDKMVGSFWRKPRHYVDDPYNGYHTREEFRTTYRKPRPYVPEEDRQ